MTRVAHGYGLATIDPTGTALDTWYPSPALGERKTKHMPPKALAAAERTDDLRNVTITTVSTEIDCDAPPANVEDAYLRLHLLSHRLVRPHDVNLDGIFGVLTNVVWTSEGPCAVDGFDEVRVRFRAFGKHLTVYGVDKFPRMVDYVVPSGVRIADADRVRLGAHLAEGTTVMHEGFVNFNAGTLGVSMVEGRISAGVVVGNGTDIGGGASIMGTLSGGGQEVITIGERTLLGANSGLGIPLGDDCVVEAGLYLTAGAKVAIAGQVDHHNNPRIVKAKDLAGRNGLLFRRNSITGGIEVVVREGAGVVLNEELHANS
ncbi:MAG: 2,3,4,5-tetrahydropyridine-2,6-dicarboxylate N-succinyltransferase [Actinobacteria bacterium HGW-Actinobacteria-4]|nr:MAG: 2,3,4,5-tetrahydropyridine-2,6-dicarboxylate N-succinyltransferase [Actinobacteria bacterium HGW-Actinobacteria-4]